MPRKDLEQFVRERLTALDPSLDISSGSRADTEVIQPVLDYFGADVLGTDIRGFVLDTLRRTFPEKNIQQDGVVDDLVAKVAGALMDPVVREIALQKRRQVPDPKAHTLESARLFSGTLFVPIVDGGRATGIERLYYSAPVSEIVRPENTLFARSGSRYTPTAVQSITKTEMQLNVENGLYYFDIAISAVDPGTQGNAEPGTIDRAPSITRAVRVRNPYKLTGGVDGDTVTTYFRKARVYPTEISLSVSRGIQATLDREFAGAVTRLEVVGMGDPDMIRDVITGGNLGPAILLDDKDGWYADTTGSYFPSTSPTLRSYLFRHANADIDFTALFPATDFEDEQYYLVTMGSSGSVYAQSRIAEVLDARTVRVVDPVVPIETYQRWHVRRRYISLSDVPGGILVPDTVDGTVEIKDDEIHVGGCTDFHVHSELDTGSTTLESASDETAVATGSNARLGGESGWTWSSRWVRLDIADTKILGPVSVTSSPTSYSVKTGLKKGVNDISDVKCRKGWFGQKMELPLWSDICVINNGGLLQRFQIDEITTDPADDYYIFTFSTALPGGMSFPTVMDIVRVIPDGITPGWSMLSVTYPTGEKLFRILDATSGFYQGDYDDPDNHQLELRVSNRDGTLTQPLGYRWTIVDSIDIDLSSPKRVRVDGLQASATLVTTAASQVVTTAEAINLETYGVKANDLLRINAGSLAGDYVIREDPSGPGFSIVKIQGDMAGSGLHADWTIFASETPADLPLVDLTAVSKVTAEGTGISTPMPGTFVPPADPAGAISTQFANAGTGLKWRRGDCVTGICARVELPSVSIDFGASDYILLVGYSQAWGQIYKLLNAVGSYDLGTHAGRRDLLDDLNAGLPADYFIYLDDEDNIIPSSTSNLHTLTLYLAVNPFDSDETSPYAGMNLSTKGDPTLIFTDTGGSTFATTSRTVVFNQLTSAMLVNRLAISVWNDLVIVETGSNAGQGQIIEALTQNTTHLLASMFPGVRLLPQRNVTAALGSPSVGYGRTFFRDPTLFQVGPGCVFADGDKRFIPDPRLSAQISPGYPQTETNKGLTVNTGTSPYTLVLPSSYGTYGMQLGDQITAGVRRIRFNWDFLSGDYNVATAQTYIFAFEGGQTITVNVPVGNYTREDFKDLFNAALGEDIAGDWDVPGKEYMDINTDDRISTLTGTGPAAIGTTPAWATHTQLYGNLSILGLPSTPYYFYAVDAENPAQLEVQGPPSGSGETSADDQVRFTVTRYLHQRFSSALIQENQHDNGLYYADVELIGLGAGNEWNIAPDRTFTVTGYQSLGYRLRPVSPNSSFSSREVPMLSITPWFLDPTADEDSPANQAEIYAASIRLDYLYSSVAESVQQLASSDSARELLESVLVKTMFPCRVYMGISYTGGPLESELRPELESYIQEQAESLDMSGIIDLLRRLGADEVITPVEMAGVYVKADRVETFVLAKDRIEITRLAAFMPGRLVLRRVG